MSAPVITNIEDLRELAKHKVPRMFYDYADSGSWTESTYRANEADFQKIKLRQRVAVDIEKRSLKTKMIGIDVAMPVALAPIGMLGMQHADGEILAARAAGSCLKRVDLTKRLRLIGVRAGALARLADLVAPLAPHDREAAPAAHEPVGEYSLPLFDDAS